MAFSPLAIKLKLKPWYKALVLNNPSDYFENVKMNDVIFYNKPDKIYDFIHIFVYSQLDLSKYLPLVMNCINDKTIFWISYPKLTSKLKSDLNRDKGFGLLNNLWYWWFAMISYDDTWSAMRFKKSWR